MCIDNRAPNFEFPQRCDSIREEEAVRSQRRGDFFVALVRSWAGPMNEDPVSAEKRLNPRYPALSEHMVVFAFPNSPLYQLKAKDISETGIGVIAKPDSQLLNLIEIGLETNVELLAPQDSRHTQGFYRARIVHITDLEEGRFKGHKLIALELLSKVSSSGTLPSFSQ